MKPENEYNPAFPKQAAAFNSQLSFADTAHEATRAEREQATDNVLRLVEVTKSQISQQD